MSDYYPMVILPCLDNWGIRDNESTASCFILIYHWDKKYCQISKYSQMQYTRTHDIMTNTIYIQVDQKNQ